MSGADQPRASSPEDQQLARTRQHRHVLLELVAASKQPYEVRLKQLLRAAADMLAVARVGYWALGEGAQSIRCEALYLAAEDRFESGTVLEQSVCPRYFQAICAGEPVVAADARTHPGTSELAASYLEPLGIGAMLDIPVYVRGALAGVICHEHVGPAREWRIDEQLFSMSLAQLIALALSEHRRDTAEEALQKSEDRFRSIVDASPVPMLVLSYPDELCLYANEAARTLTGVDYSRLIGEKIPALYADVAQHRGVMAEVAAFGRVDKRQVTLRRSDGSTFWAVISLRQSHFGGGPATIVGISDLTEQKRLEEQLRHAAFHDPLTGLPNRTQFFDLLRQELARSRRSPSYEFAVLFIDLDEFKRINDSLGHEAGDALLQAVAERLRNALKPMDNAARFGGGKFVAILANLTMSREAEKRAAEIGAALNAPYDIGGHAVEARALVGVVHCDERIREPRDVLREADAAMLQLRARAALNR